MCDDNLLCPLCGIMEFDTCLNTYAHQHQNEMPSDYYPVAAETKEEERKGYYDDDDAGIAEAGDDSSSILSPCSNNNSSNERDNDNDGDLEDGDSPEEGQEEVKDNDDEEDDDDNDAASSEGFTPSELERRENTDWMNDYLVFGKNPSTTASAAAAAPAPDEDRVWASGKAQHSHSSIFRISDRGNDPNFPTTIPTWDEGRDGGFWRDIVYMGGQEVVTAVCFERVEGNSVMVSVHVSCLDSILQRVMRREKSDSEAGGSRKRFMRSGNNQARFYKILSELPMDGSVPHDYGETNLRRRCQCNDYPACMNEQWFFADPVDIPLLQDLYVNLPRLDRESINKAKERQHETQKHRHKDASDKIHNAFSCLPPEIILNIFGHLSIQSISAFRATSRSLAHVPLGNSFWKSRVTIDMPWLFDIPAAVLHDREIDWISSYTVLLRKSTAKLDEKIPGLANRKRIWKACEKIADIYMKPDTAPDLSPAGVDGGESREEIEAARWLDWYKNKSKTQNEETKYDTTMLWPTNEEKRRLGEQENSEEGDGRLESYGSESEDSGTKSERLDSEDMKT